MTRIYQIKHSDADSSLMNKRGKDTDVRALVEKIVSKKDKELMKSMISDFPAEKDCLCHNCD